jgi:CheY-like chemotaxis protein
VIRVLVVDDSALWRLLLTELINEGGDLKVVGAAPDAATAREMLRALNPDLMTLDIEMPRMDGLIFSDRNHAQRPLPVIMISAFTAARFREGAAGAGAGSRRRTWRSRAAIVAAGAAPRIFARTSASACAPPPGRDRRTPPGRYPGRRLRARRKGISRRGRLVARSAPRPAAPRPSRKC